jgi:hypothetical protein
MRTSNVLRARKLFLLMLLPAFAHAEPIAALQPLGFLAGHCWKGTLRDPQTTDEHCFEWMYGGKFLRDRHVVRSPGKPDYIGETTYYWDAEAKQIRFLYVENLGAVSQGTAEAAPDGVFFPNARYVDGNGAMTYRSRWTRIDGQTYEAHAEMQAKDGWTTMFRTKLTKQP